MTSLFTKLKLIFLVALFLGAANLFAQSVHDPSSEIPGYDADKANTLDENARMILEQKQNSGFEFGTEPTDYDMLSSGCFIPVDGSFTAVPRNDDGSYGPVYLPFTFSLYGSDYNQIYINTNGNVTFTGPISWYSASGFPFGTPMVAPFWGDVDTRCGGGAIYFKVSSTNVIVTWNGVGYYGCQYDKLNTFQAIIGTYADELTGVGQNVSLRYADMQWTTGNASGGSGGFGGVPATVGINKGDGTNYVQIGRFNQNSSIYDGPGGNYDGVHYLDNQCVAFNVSSAGNIPPSFTNLPSGNTIDLVCGQTANYNITAIAPEVNQNVSISANTGGLCDVTANVSGSSVNLTVTASPCNEGSHVISLTAVDNGNPVESTTVDITVNVSNCCQPPVLTCPANMIVSTDDNSCGAVVEYAATASGTTPQINYSIPSGSVFPVGTTEVFVSAANDCGTDQCSFFVTVEDNSAPVISCPENQVLNTEAGLCGAYATFEASATDNCDVTISYSHTSGDLFPTGFTTVTATATDASGNSSECTFDIEVVDNEIPNIACPFDITVYAEPGVCGATVFYEQPTATDNCGTLDPPTSLPGFTYKGMLNGHTYFISNSPLTPEAAHASALATGGHLATISSYEENLFVSSMSPARIWIGISDRDVEGQWEWITSEPVTYTNWAPGEPNDYGSGEDWAVINWSGNNPDWNDWYSFVSAYYSVEFDGGGLPTELVSGLESGSFFPVGENVVTYSATDPSGNAIECSFTVTVIDNQAPELTSVSGTNYTSQDGVYDCLYTGYSNNGGGYYTILGDNCSSEFTVVEEEYFDGQLVSTYTWTLGAGGSIPYRAWPLGETTMVITVYDDAGNASSTTYTQTVLDDEAPMALANDISVELDASGLAQITVDMIDIGSYDNCTLESVSIDVSEFSCADVGANTVVLTATDIFGNQSTADVTVTVYDNVAPVAVCQDVTVTLSDGMAFVTPEMVDNGSNDACGIASLELDVTSFDCSNIGSNPVVLTVTDNNGNASTCTANVEVVGEIPSCSIDVELENDTYTGGDGYTIFLGYGPQALTATVTAEGGAPFTYNWSGGDGYLSSTTSASPVFSPEAGGVYDLVCEVTNAYGCTTTCEVTICVKDIRAGGNGNNQKVYLCHAPPGNPNNAKTLKVSVNAVPAHLENHEYDRLGRCDQECGDFKTDFADIHFDEGHDPVLSVYPNPTTTSFFVVLDSHEDEEIQLTIYDHLGKLILSNNEITPNEALEFGNDLPAGLYYVKVVQGEFTQNIKLVKAE